MPRELSAAPERLPEYLFPPSLDEDGEAEEDESDAQTPEIAAGSPAAPGAPPAGTAANTAAATVGRVTDRSGDAGLRAPAYADLVAVTIQDTGSRARVLVDVAGDLPGRPAQGEVMGIGVDLFVGTGGESDYQLFAEGSSQGWFAYLQTPTGFIRYPGSFLIGGRRVGFEVPWASLGQARRGRFSAFLDWSRKEVPLNATGQDHAPDRGTVPFDR